MRLITVGTPFLRFRSRKQEVDIHQRAIFSAGRVSWLMASVLAGLTLAASMSDLGREPPSGHQLSTDTEIDLASWVPLNGFSVAVNALTITLAAAGFFAIVAIAVLSTMSWVTSRLRPQEPTWAAVPLTTVRTRRDEAAFALKAGSLLSAFVDRTRKALDRLPTLVALPTFLVLVALVAGVSIGAEVGHISILSALALNSFPHPQVVSVVAALAAVPATLALAISLVAIIEAVACGFDGVPLLSHGRTSMRSQPRILEAEHEVVLGRSKRLSLRHCRLMEDKGSVEVITAVCGERLSSMQAETASRRLDPDAER
jgi:hypothetical protein